MSVQKTLTLDISNFNNKVDTIYTKSATTDLELTVFVVNNGKPYELPEAQNIIVLSNYGAYQDPITARYVDGNKAIFDMNGVYRCGWTICSLRIDNGTGDDDVHDVVETQNFQIYCEESPDGDESIIELSVAARLYLDEQLGIIQTNLNNELTTFETRVDTTLDEIDLALTDLLGTTGS